MRGRWLCAAFIKGLGHRLQGHYPAVSDGVLLRPTSIGWHDSRCSRRRILSSTHDAPDQSLVPTDTASDAFDGSIPTAEWINEDSSPSSSQPRRVRYSGKYPRNFNEKYKELANDEATVQKVLNKGSTPAGRHLPILLKECLFHLGLEATTGSSATRAPTIYVDCTLGYGGHASAVLERLIDSNEHVQINSGPHTMVCFDRDPIEIVKATERLQSIVTQHAPSNFVQVTTVNRNFGEIRSHLEASAPSVGVGAVTALLADLGLSSMQIDDASRGFTYKRDGPLDMRMSSTSQDTESAFDLLSRLTIPEFTKLLQENSDEEHAAIIAKAVVGTGPVPATTVELAHRVRDAVRPRLSTTTAPRNGVSSNTRPKPTKAYEKKQLDSTVARVMQAIRISVNAEFEALEQLLDDLPHLLAPGGRAVILTFHSGEDRRVKKSFKAGFKSGIYSSWSRDVVRPTLEEQRENSRSSCCKLRWVIRSDQKC